jgi:hypothetical protein
MYSFGPGTLFGTNTAANSTPRKFGGLQDVNLDFSFTVKELYGNYQFPLAIARGQGKIQGKSKFATINGAVLNDLFFGQSMATSNFNGVVNDEAGTVPAVTTFTITVANSATWVTDLGVIDTLTGLAMVKVAAAPITGQYSCAAGIYTFAAADASKAVKISYIYTIAAGTLKQMTINNQLIGTTPLFAAAFTTVFQGKSASFILNRCTASKLTFATKLDDYVIPEFDFSCFADDSGVIGTLTFSD